MKPSDPCSCPECGKPVPAGSSHRVCPACLMEQALVSRTLVEGVESGAMPVPAADEIARHFPQFEMLRCLGRGGMGVVYQARQKSLDRLVAIKILPPERVGEARFAERFEREAQMLAKLNHPDIVTVFDYGETGGLFYIVMEYVDGVNLRELLRDGRLEPAQALAIVPPVCEALQYAHGRGIVHRDIKPENLLLDRSGRVKIADFGIAALIGADGERIGTPPYMAPEQCAEAGDVDLRADIYALGVVLYEMLTGERPAREWVAPSRKSRADVRLDAMVRRALEKDPERRFQSAEEFRTAAETMAEIQETPRKSSKRRKKVNLRLKGRVPDRGTLLGITGLCLLAGGMVGGAGLLVSNHFGTLRALEPDVSSLPAGMAEMVWGTLAVIGGGIGFLALALLITLVLIARGPGSGAGKGLAAGFLMLLFGGLIAILMAAGLWIGSEPRRIPDLFGNPPEAVGRPAQ